MSLAPNMRSAGELDSTPSYGHLGTRGSTWEQQGTAAPDIGGIRNPASVGASLGPRSFDPWAGVDFSTHYPGPNTKRGDVVSLHVQTIVTRAKSALCQIVLPFALHQGSTDISWNRTTYHSHVAALVPEEGPAPTVSDRSERQTTRMLQYAIALEMPLNTLDTPDGDVRYRSKLQQIKTGVLQRFQMLVMAALFEAKETLHTHMAMTTGKRFEYPDALMDNIRNFGCVQKVRDGALVAFGSAVALMRDRSGGFEADTAVVPQGFYAIKSKEENVTYYLTGPDMVKKEERFMPLKTYAGLHLVEAPTYHDHGEAAPTDMSVRPAQVGEYVAFIDRNIDSGSAYTTASRSIEVYDEQDDQYVVLPLSALIRACNRFRHDLPNGPLDESTHNAFIRAFQDSNGTYEAERQRAIAIDPFIHSIDTDHTGSRAAFAPVRYMGDISPVFLSDDACHAVTSSVLAALGARNATTSSTIDSQFDRDVNTIESFVAEFGDSEELVTREEYTKGEARRGRNTVPMGFMTWDALGALETSAGDDLKEKIKKARSAFRNVCARLRGLFPHSAVFDSNFSPFSKLHGNAVPADTRDHAALWDAFVVPPGPMLGVVNGGGGGTLTIGEVIDNAKEAAEAAEANFLAIAKADAQRAAEEVGEEVGGTTYTSALQAALKIGNTTAGGAGGAGASVSGSVSSPLRFTKEKLETVLQQATVMGASPGQLGIIRTWINNLTATEDKEVTAANVEGANAFESTFTLGIESVADPGAPGSERDDTRTPLSADFNSVASDVVFTAARMKGPRAEEVLAITRGVCVFDAPLGNALARSYIYMYERASADSKSRVGEVVDRLQREYTQWNNVATTNDEDLRASVQKAIGAFMSLGQGARGVSTTGEVTIDPTTGALKYGTYTIGGGMSAVSTGIQATKVEPVYLKAGPSFTKCVLREKGGSHKGLTIFAPVSVDASYAGLPLCYLNDEAKKEMNNMRDTEFDAFHTKHPHNMRADAGASERVDVRGLFTVGRDRGSYGRSHATGGRGPGAPRGGALAPARSGHGWEATFGNNMATRRDDMIFSRATSPMRRALCAAWLFAPMNTATLLRMCENNIRVPVGFGMFRPYQTYAMASAVVCKAGLGRTYYSHMRYDEGASASTKGMVGNFTFYSQAVVHDHRQLIQLRDIAFRGALGGANTRFMNLRPRYASESDYVDEVITQVEAKATCISVPLGMTEEPNVRIDMSGASEAITSTDGPHYSSAAYTRWALCLSGPSEVETPLTPFQRRRKLNTILCRGYQGRWAAAAMAGDRVLGGHTNKLQNTGHAGYAGPGALGLRSGLIGSIDSLAPGTKPGI